MLNRKPIYWIDGLSLVLRSQYYVLVHKLEFQIGGLWKDSTYLLDMHSPPLRNCNIYLRLYGKIRVLFLFNKLMVQRSKISHISYIKCIVWTMPLCKFGYSFNLREEYMLQLELFTLSKLILF